MDPNAQSPQDPAQAPVTPQPTMPEPVMDNTDNPVTPQAPVDSVVTPEPAPTMPSTEVPTPVDQTGGTV